METNKPFIVVICGPTGVGKTSIAIKLAKKFSGEIISSDSVQIYRYLNIGTAKPTAKELSQVTHHLIDIINPDESFDAAEFAKRAREKSGILIKNKILPFIVGGTGFYIKAFVHGLFRSRSVNLETIEKLEKDIKTFGNIEIHKRLLKCDPEAGRRIHPNDKFRVVRAMEVFQSTGKTISQYQKEHAFQENPYNVLQIGLNMERSLLYDRINKRVDLMISNGFIEEVKKLLENGYCENLKSMQSIGYRHIIDYVQKKITLDKTVELLKRDTRRYAKRQLTWFKKDININWIDVKETDRAFMLINKKKQVRDEV